MNMQPNLIFNRSLWQQRLSDACRKNADFFIQKIALEHLLLRVEDTTNIFEQGFLLSVTPPVSIPKNLKYYQYYVPCQQPHIKFFDEEHQSHPQTYDIIMSNCCLHRTNDMVGALIQYKNALSEHGLFHSVCIGEQSMIEWRQAFIEEELKLIGGASQRMMPFIDIKTMGALMQRVGYTTPIIDKISQVITYKDKTQFLRDLKQMAGQSFLHDNTYKHATKNLLYNVLRNIKKNYGRYQITIDFLFIHAWNNNKKG